MITLTLTNNEATSLIHCLNVAQDRFLDNAREIRLALDVEHPSSAAWERMAVQFERQQVEASELADLINSALYGEED